MDLSLKKLLIGFMTFLTIIISFGQNNLISANPCQNSRTGNNTFGCTTFFNATLDSKPQKIVMFDLETNKILNPNFNVMDVFGDIASTICTVYILEHIYSGKPVIGRLHFSQQDVSPQVTSIKVNSAQICSGPEGSWVTEARISISKPQFEPPTNTNSGHSTSSTPNEDGPKWSHFTLEGPLTLAMLLDYNNLINNIFKPSQTQQRQALEYINSVCGLENGNVIKLQTNGKTVVRSRFPWIVAIFKNNRNNNNIEFQCGGSLISTKTIVSVAHCFYDGLTFLPPEDILVSLGRYNLTDLTEGQCLGVHRIIGHPQYNPTAFSSDADVAILLLKESVLFTLAIRPVCMWQGPSDSINIQDTTGIIVGWGSDAHRNTTTVPTLVHTTVVSEVQCLRSNAAFMSTTSNRTLCAGNPSRNSGPCTGDSGNGLMIRKDKIWMLRGAVSIALGTPDGRCNVEEYAVYSDIAKFMDWIRTNMLL